MALRHGPRLLLNAVPWVAIGLGPTPISLSVMVVSHGLHGDSVTSQVIYPTTHLRAKPTGYLGTRQHMRVPLAYFATNMLVPLYTTLH